MSKSLAHYVLNYSKADWRGLSEYLLDYDFSSLYTIKDLDSLWTHFKCILTEATHRFIPKIKVNSSRSPKWFTPEIRHEFNRNHTLRRLSKKKPSSTNALRLQHAESHLQEIMLQAKSNFESHLVESFAFNNPQKLYAYIKSFSKQASFPHTMFLDSVTASTDGEKASLFNSYFYSVFSTTSFILPPMANLPSPNSTLANIEISESDVLEVLASLDPSKAVGPDGIGPNVLKYCSFAICGPLYHLFSLCLSQHNIPSEWRRHSITPILKSGNKASVRNYRPISLLSVTSKVLERIIYNKVVHFITETVISSNQFGFLKNRSTLQQLLVFINSIYSAHAATDVIYLDFRKAFDSVSHPELLFKLWVSGITGDIWLWFQAYLSNRSQLVSINGVQSSTLPVVSGVPQGSILGPILFLLFINDLPRSAVTSSMFLFADDAKCAKAIHSFSDTLDLQRDLVALGAWARKWNLYFNETKCIHLRFLPYSHPAPEISYAISDFTISSSAHHRDLGVYMSNDLSWSDHHNIIISKAYQSLGMIRRTFTTNSVSTKRQLYLSLVRSQLSYCSPTWRPHLSRDIIKLERVQRRATKYILDNYSSDYKSRLIELNLLPLMYFYELTDLMYFINSLKNPTDSFDINSYVSFSDTSTRSTMSCKLKHATSQSTAHRHFYFNRLPRLWNSLPPFDLNYSSRIIKSHLHEILWNHFLSNFDSQNSCTYHYSCPCCKCSVYKPPNFSLVTGRSC